MTEKSDEEEKEEVDEQRKLRHARLGVFDTMLSFNAKRLTLQQLFEWARHFRRFLVKGPINSTMKQYTDILTTDDGGWTSNSMGAEKIGKVVEFKVKYFGKFDETGAGSFLPEVRWLFENIEYVQ